MMNNNDERAIDSVIGRAWMLLDRRRLDDARALIMSELKSAPEHQELLHLAGCVEYLDDNNERALESLEQLLAFQPEHEGARILLYQVCREDRRLTEAEQVLLSLIKDFPEDPAYYAWYALLMIETGDFDKAEKLTDEAVRLDPENEESLIASATCALVLQRGSEPRVRLSELVRQHPDSERTLSMLAIFLSEQGRAREALQITQELLLADPSNEDLVANCVALKVATHWSMLPLWPIVRFGWLGAAAVWALGVAYMVFVMPHLSDPLAIAFLHFIIVYWIYSTVYPFMLKRLISR